jgi:hypothetical protein
MNLFSEIEKTIERGFRRWTEKVFGPADSDQLLLLHRAILEQIEGQVQTVAKGRRIFPYSRVTVTLISPEEAQRTLYQAAFGERLETDLKEALDSAGCELPKGFHVEVETAAGGEGNLEIAYGVEKQEPKPPKPCEPARLSVVKGKTAAADYTLDKARTNIGRLAELTDADQRVIRRNDVVFEEGADEANSTVSRKHAHIRREGDDYRLCDDESEFGTRVFRDGRSIDVPPGNRRGEKLRDGDEIYLGRACLRFVE